MSKSQVGAPAPAVLRKPAPEHAPRAGAASLQIEFYADGHAHVFLARLDLARGRLIPDRMSDQGGVVWSPDGIAQAFLCAAAELVMMAETGELGVG